jgi:hypothetical protein
MNILASLGPVSRDRAVERRISTLGTYGGKNHRWLIIRVRVMGTLKIRLSMSNFQGSSLAFWDQRFGCPRESRSFDAIQVCVGAHENRAAGDGK